MLTVYRASAGAGKTHTLTGEYLSVAAIQDAGSFPAYLSRHVHE